VSTSGVGKQNHIDPDIQYTYSVDNSEDLD
jgi:hypothetical protein